MVILLTGCATSPAEVTPLVADEASNILPAAPPIGDPLASGTLYLEDGREVGDVEIRAAERGTAEIVISHYFPTVEPVSGRLSAVPLDFVGCFDTGYAVGLPDLTDESTQVYPLGDLSDLPFADRLPSLGLMALRAPAEEADCLLVTVAIADLVWAGEPELELPADWMSVDGGPAVGANGTTTEDPSGKPVSYVVAEGDTADQIRARFDIYWDSLADENGITLVKYPVLYPGDVLTFVPPDPHRHDE